jgi:hypothetical protein
MKENGMMMIRASHPSYSPDLASPDFYLFGYVKLCLRGQSFKSTNELFSSIEAVLRAIEKSTLNAVFLEWMERLERCNAANRDEFEAT